MSKKSKSAARHNLTIKSKVTLSRILEVTNNSLRIEINDKGTIAGRYTGTQLGTIDNTTGWYFKLEW